MTVIVAIRRADGGISMAADKRVTVKDGFRIPMKDSKLGTVGDMLVGVCGSTAPGEILLSCDPPARDGLEPLHYLRTVLAPFLREKIAAAGLDDQDWGAMVAIEGRVFDLDEELGVTEINADYWAAGAGKLAALGCLYGLAAANQFTSGDKAASEILLRVAVDAAEQFDTSCGDGMDLIHV